MTKETKTGRNIEFQDLGNHHKMTRQEFVNRIKNPNSVYNTNYYVRNINGIETPVSKSNNNKKDNLE